MADGRPLTIAMIDAILDELSGPWYCPAGYRHEQGHLCLHDRSLPHVRARLRMEARRLRARLEGRSDG